MYFSQLISKPFIIKIGDTNKLFKQFILKLYYPDCILINTVPDHIAIHLDIPRKVNSRSCPFSIDRLNESVSVDIDS